MQTLCNNCGFYVSDINHWVAQNNFQSIQDMFESIQKKLTLIEEKLNQCHGNRCGETGCTTVSNKQGFNFGKLFISFSAPNTQSVNSATATTSPSIFGAQSVNSAMTTTSQPICSAQGISSAITTTIQSISNTQSVNSTIITTSPSICSAQGVGSATTTTSQSILNAQSINSTTTTTSQLILNAQNVNSVTTTTAPWICSATSINFGATTTSQSIFNAQNVNSVTKTTSPPIFSTQSVNSVTTTTTPSIFSAPEINFGATTASQSIFNVQGVNSVTTTSNPSIFSAPSINFGTTTTSQSIFNTHGVNSAATTISPPILNPRGSLFTQAASNSTGQIFSRDAVISPAPKHTVGTAQGSFRPSTQPFTFFLNPYHRESIRLQSFKNWPVSFIEPSQLAAAGFYYLNLNNDVVQCAFCGFLNSNWVEGRDPLQDHQKWSPDCKFIKKLPCGNISLAEEPSTTKTGSNPVATANNFSDLDFHHSRTSTEMSDAEARRIVNEILPKFIAYRDVQMIKDSLKNKFLTEADRNKFLHWSIVYSLEKHDHHEIIAPLFANLLDVKYNDPIIFTPSVLADRFHKIISSAEDYIMNYPKFWEILAKILAHTLTAETFDFGHLKLSCGPVLKLEIRKHLLSLIFQNLSSLKSPAWIRLKWKKSNVLLNQFLPEDYIGPFITVNNLGYLIDPKAAELIPATPPSFDHYKNQLSQILQHDNSDNTLSAVIDWANAHFGSAPYTSSFIKPLVTTIFDLSVAREANNNGYFIAGHFFQSSIMDRYQCIIRFFVTPDSSLQRHCLSALAMLIHNWHFPEGAARDIVRYLIGNELISSVEFENLMTKKSNKRLHPEFAEDYFVQEFKVKMRKLDLDGTAK